MTQSSDAIIDAVHRERLAVQLWQTVGAAKLANQIVSSLGSQSLHALERIRDEKLYLGAGFETFAEFLDKHPDSPMGHDAFRRRINLLKSEGEFAFDLLNSLNVPINTRKLLAGGIAIDGDEIEIAGVKCSLTDTARVKEIIKDLADKTAELQRTTKRQGKQLAQGQKDFDELKKRVIHANPDGTETGQAILTAAGSLARLRETLEAAPDEEKLAVKESIFTLLRNSQLELSGALGVITRAEVSEVKGSQGEVDDEDSELMEQM